MMFNRNSTGGLFRRATDVRVHGLRVKQRRICVDAVPGLNDERDSKADDQRQRRYHFEVNNGTDSDAAHILHALHLVDATHDRHEDNRSDHHPDQFYETVGEGFHRLGKARVQIADENADRHRDQNMNPQLAIQGPPAFGSACHVRRDCITDMGTCQSSAKMNAFICIEEFIMQYSKLGNTGLIISRLSFGAMTFWYGNRPFRGCLQSRRRECASDGPCIDRCGDQLLRYGEWLCSRAVRDYSWPPSWRQTTGSRHRNESRFPNRQGHDGSRAVAVEHPRRLRCKF
jgi:hypothetical protein